MKKPLNGDYLTIRYQGATLRARCDEIRETPDRGPGAANFTIASETQFQRGHEAHLVEGSQELPIHIERVAIVGRRRLNIVTLGGIFESATRPASPVPSPNIA